MFTVKVHTVHRQLLKVRVFINLGILMVMNLVNRVLKCKPIFNR